MPGRMGTARARRPTGYPLHMTAPLTALVHEPAERVFAGLARLRRAKAFHPRGTVARGVLRLDDPASTLGSVLGVGERPVEARLSRGIGLPEHLPDILGLALRVPSDAGPVDLLMTSVAPGRLGAFVLLPSPRWTARRFSTLLPYVGPVGSVVIGAEAVHDHASTAALDEARAAIAGGGLELHVLEHPRHGGWRIVGRVRLDQHATMAPDGFDPVLNAHPRLRLARGLTTLRAAAYAGSRRGRGRGDQVIAVPTHPDAEDPGP